jgi:hypothetical protein
MRFPQTILALSALAATQGCLGAVLGLEAIAPKCTQEQIVVTWPITITRGSSVSSPLLTTTLTQTNIDRAQFDVLRQSLTEGGETGAYNVMWTIPAFNVNGGYISLTHFAPLATGETQQVNVAFSGGGWGAHNAAAANVPGISVRADNFVATSATGSITALAAAPLRLRIDITTANAAGETIRLTGDAGFSYHKVQALCS